MVNNRQRQIIRHALGLDVKRKTFRNFYQAPESGDDAAVLSDAVEKGLMVRREIDPVYCGYGKQYAYRVTAAAALQVINPGEKLDQFEFPGVSLQGSLWERGER